MNVLWDVEAVCLALAKDTRSCLLRDGARGFEPWWFDGRSVRDIRQSWQNSIESIDSTRDWTGRTRTQRAVSDLYLPLYLCVRGEPRKTIRAFILC